jgi:hypothetical protein
MINLEIREWLRNRDSENRALTAPLGRVMELPQPLKKIIMASSIIEPMPISYFLILLVQSPIFSKYSPVLLPCINPASTDGW